MGTGGFLFALGLVMRVPPAADRLYTRKGSFSGAGAAIGRRFGRLRNEVLSHWSAIETPGCPVPLVSPGSRLRRLPPP